MKCSQCGSGNVQRRGNGFSHGRPVKKLYCKDCGAWTAHEKAEDIPITPTPEVEPLILRDRDRQIARLKEERSKDAKLIAALEVEASEAHKRGEVLEALRAPRKDGQPFKVKAISEGNLSINLPNGALIFGELRCCGFWVSRWFERAEAATVKAMLEEMAGLLRSGALQLPVAATYPLERAGEAIAHARQGGRGGKILLNCA